MFDRSGKLIKEIIKSGYLAGARSLRMAPGSVVLCAAVPSQNMIAVFTAAGEPVNNIVTNFGDGLGQLAHPAFAAFGKKGGVFVVDTDNGRIQHLDDKFNYIQFYRIGTMTVDNPPQVMAFDDGKVPYIMATQPLYRRLLLYPLGENRIRMLELKDIRGVNLAAPSAIASDGSGAIYLLDPKAKAVVKITLPKDVINDPPRVRGQGR